MSTDILLQFWFDDWTDDQPLPENSPRMKLWWGKNDAVDTELRARFTGAHFVAARGELATTTGIDAVAAILLLDQIPRNIFRGTAHMFATDGLAREATRRLIDHGLEELAPIHRYFSLMPLMHAEDLESHDLAIEHFSALAKATEKTSRAGVYKGALDYEHKHRDIIVKFGRYPHRNAMVGRASTDQERTFLTQPGSAF